MDAGANWQKAAIKSRALFRRYNYTRNDDIGALRKIERVQSLLLNSDTVDHDATVTAGATVVGNHIAATIRLNDGNHIPQVGLGVYKALPGLDGETETAVYNALKLGYRHIDTAEEYGNEADVGRAIRRFIMETGINRNELWITTKFYPTPGRGKADVHQALKDSLHNLELSYVDLYLIHSPNEVSLRKEQWEAMEELKDQGKTRSIGVSNYGIHHLREIIDDKRTRYIPAVNQIELSPYTTRIDLVKYCKQHGILPQAYSPLTKSIKLSDPKLCSIADRYGVTPAQVLLRWCVQKGYSLLPKSTQPHRLQENMNLYGDCFHLSMRDMHALDGFDEYLITGWDPTRGP